jgi:hypothetical protein
MKEYIHVEFLFIGDEFSIWFDKIQALGEDFVKYTHHHEIDTDEDGFTERYVRFVGKMESELAAVIKLQDPYLAQHMRVSYIPDTLKDKYRK